MSKKWNNYIERWNRVNSVTTGREKLFRFVRLLQYSCQLISSVSDNPTKHQNVSKIKKLETILSLTQKLMRFGRAVETLNSSLNTLSITDGTIRVTTTLSRISMSMYLFSDHVLWLTKVGLVSGNSQKWSTLSYRFWLYSVTMNLIRDFYEIRELLKQYSVLNRSCFMNRNMSFEERLALECNALLNVMLSHRNVSVETLKNLCDFWIPMHYLGHVRINSTVLALLGITSSIASILQIMDYSYRLSPN